MSSSGSDARLVAERNERAHATSKNNASESRAVWAFACMRAHNSGRASSQRHKRTRTTPPGTGEHHAQSHAQQHVAHHAQHRAQRHAPRHAQLRAQHAAATSCNTRFAICLAAARRHQQIERLRCLHVLLFEGSRVKPDNISRLNNSHQQLEQLCCLHAVALE